MCRLYRGYSVHFVCNNIRRAVFFLCYGGIKREISISIRGTESGINNVTTPKRMEAAAALGIVFFSVVHLFDAVRTRIFGSCLSVWYQSAPDVAGEMWRANSSRAFTRGFRVESERGGPVLEVAMSIYDIALEYFNGRERGII